MGEVEAILSGLSLADNLQDPTAVAARASDALANCGGPSAVAAEADALASGPLLPELIMLADAAQRVRAIESADLVAAVEAGLAVVTRPLVLAYAADALVACPALTASIGRRLETSLLERYTEARAASEGDLAYRLLETLARLALGGVWREHRVLAEMLDIGADDPTELASRAPRLLGVALDVWGDDALIDVLRDLQQVPEARADSSLELALAELRTALSADDQPTLFKGLQKARRRFEGILFEEARDDAALYASAIDAVLAFTGDPDAVRLATIADDLEGSWARRRAWSSGTRLVDWLAPREAAETRWAELVGTLRAAALDLRRASWLQPYDALERVLAAYTLDRSVEVVAHSVTFGSVRALVRPAIEAAFVQREGLLGHLRDVLATDQKFAERRDAVELLQRVDTLRAEEAPSSGDAPGKAWAVAPALASRLGTDTTFRLVSGIDPNIVAALENLVYERTVATSLTRDPLLDDLLAGLWVELEDCSSFVGIVRKTFMCLVESTVRFVSFRADVGSTTGGTRISYLFEPAGDRNGQMALPTERPLQNDYREWLADTSLRAVADTEVTDIASGRADVKVSFGGLRYLTEVKRELSDASRENLRTKYTGQAAAYAGTSAELGQLLVLDLTDHTRGFPGLRDSVWVERVPVTGGSDRFLVVEVVRGNRRVPSATKGPSP